MKTVLLVRIGLIALAVLLVVATFVVAAPAFGDTIRPASAGVAPRICRVVDGYPGELQPAPEIVCRQPTGGLVIDGGR